MNLSVTRLVIPRHRTTPDASSSTVSQSRSRQSDVPNTEEVTRSLRTSSWLEDDGDTVEETSWLDPDLVREDDESVLRSFLKAVPGATRAILSAPRETLKDLSQQGVVGWRIRRRGGHQRGEADETKRRMVLFAFEGEKWVILREGFGAIWFEHVPRSRQELFRRGSVRVGSKLSAPLRGAFNADGTLFAFGVEDELMVMWEGAAMGEEVPVPSSVDEKLTEKWTRQIVGLGFVSKHQHLVCVTRSGAVYQAHATENYAELHFVTVLRIPGSEEFESSTPLAAVMDDRIFVASSQQLSIFRILHDGGDADNVKPTARVTPLGSMPLFVLSSGVVPRAGVRRKAANAARRLMGMKSCDELVAVNQIKFNAERTRLALMNARRDLVIVDISSSAPSVISERVLEVQRAVKFSFVADGSVVLGVGGAITVVSDRNLEEDLLDRAEGGLDTVMLPTLADMDISRKGEIAFLLQTSPDDEEEDEEELARIGLIRPCSVEEMLVQLVEQNDFEGAFALCTKRKLSRDVVHKKLFETLPVTKQTMEEHLFKISDRKWILETCVHRIPAESLNLCLELLVFARRLCAKDEVHFITRLETLLERTEAYKTCFAEDGEFNSKQYERFRDESTSALDQAKRLALQGKTSELERFCFETAWGRRDLSKEDLKHIITSCVAESCRPAACEHFISDLGSEHLAAEWFIRSAVDVEKRTGLLQNALELVEMGLSMHTGNESLRTTREEILHLRRLVYELGVDYSLGLDAWLHVLTPLDKLRICFTDRELFWRRAQPLIASNATPPAQAQRWLIALRDLFVDEFSAKDGLKDLQSLLLDCPNEYMFRNRIDGRLTVLQIALDVLNRTELKVSEALDDALHLLHRLDALESETEVEKSLPKKFGPMRSELKALTRRLGVVRKLVGHIIPAPTITLSSIKHMEQVHDDSLVGRMLETVRKKELDSNGIQNLFRDVFEVANVLGVSPRAVRMKALKELLLTEHLDAAERLVSESKEDAESLRNVLADVGRELFVQGKLEACSRILAALSRSAENDAVPLGKLVRFVNKLRTSYNGVDIVPLELLLLFDRDPVELFGKVLEDHSSVLIPTSSSHPSASTAPKGKAPKKKTWIQGLTAMARVAKAEANESNDDDRGARQYHREWARNVRQRLMDLGESLGLSAKQVTELVVPKLVIQRVLLSQDRLEEAIAFVEECLSHVENEGNCWESCEVISKALFTGSDKGRAYEYLVQAVLRVPDSARYCLVEMIDSLPCVEVMIPVEEWRKEKGWRNLCAAVKLSTDPVLETVSLEAVGSEVELKSLLYARVLREKSFSDALAIFEQINSNRRLVVELVEDAFSSRRDAEIFVKGLRREAKEGDEEVAVGGVRQVEEEEEIDQDLYISDAFYRFQVVRSRLKVPLLEHIDATSLPCRDLDLDLHPIFVVRFFKCMKMHDLMALQGQESDPLTVTDWRQGFTYAVKFVSANYFNEEATDFKMEVLRNLARDSLECAELAERIEARRVKLTEFVSRCGPFENNLEALRLIGTGVPFLTKGEGVPLEDAFKFFTNVDRSSVLASAAELCASSLSSSKKCDPLVFCKLVAELSDLTMRIRPSEVLMSFLLFLLLGSTTGARSTVQHKEPDERRFLYMASRKTFETRCKPLIGKLAPTESQTFALRCAFAVDALDADTRAGLVRTCLNELSEAPSKKKKRGDEDETLKGNAKKRMQFLLSLLALESTLDGEAAESFIHRCQEYCSVAERQSLPVEPDLSPFAEFVRDNVRLLTLETVETLAMHQQALAAHWFVDGLLALTSDEAADLRTRYPLPSRIVELLESRLSEQPKEERTRLLRTMVALGTASETRLQEATAQEREEQAREIAKSAGLPGNAEGWSYLCGIHEFQSRQQISAALSIAWLYKDEARNVEEWGGLLVRLALLEPFADHTDASQWISRLNGTLALETKRRLVAGMLTSRMLAQMAFDLVLDGGSIDPDVLDLNGFVFLSHVSESDKVSLRGAKNHEIVVSFHLMRLVQRVGWTNGLFNLIPLRVLSDIVLLVNAQDYRNSVARFVSDLLVIVHDAESAFDVACMYRRFPFRSLHPRASRDDKVQFLRMFFRQLMDGIERETSRLEFSSDQLRIDALKRLNEACDLVDLLRDSLKDEASTSEPVDEENPLMLALATKPKHTSTPLKAAQGEWAWNEDTEEAVAAPPIPLPAVSHAKPKPKQPKARPKRVAQADSAVDLLLAGSNTSANTASSDLPSAVLPANTEPTVVRKKVGKTLSTKREPVASSALDLLISAPSLSETTPTVEETSQEPEERSWNDDFDISIQPGHDSAAHSTDLGPATAEAPAQLPSKPENAAEANRELKLERAQSTVVNESSVLPQVSSQKAVDDVLVLLGTTDTPVIAAKPRATRKPRGRKVGGDVPNVGAEELLMTGPAAILLSGTTRSEQATTKLAKEERDMRLDFGDAEIMTVSKSVDVSSQATAELVDELAAVQQLKHDVVAPGELTEPQGLSKDTNSDITESLTVPEPHWSDDTVKESEPIVDEVAQPVNIADSFVTFPEENTVPASSSADVNLSSPASTLGSANVGESLPKAVPHKTFSEEFSSASTQLYRLEASRLVSAWIEPAEPETPVTASAEVPALNGDDVAGTVVTSTESVEAMEHHQRRLSESEWWTGRDVAQTELFEATVGIDEAGLGAPSTNNGPSNDDVNVVRASASAVEDDVVTTPVSVGGVQEDTQITAGSPADREGTAEVGNETQEEKPRVTGQSTVKDRSDLEATLPKNGSTSEPTISLVGEGEDLDLSLDDDEWGSGTGKQPKIAGVEREVSATVADDPFALLVQGGGGPLHSKPLEQKREKPVLSEDPLAILLQSGASESVKPQPKPKSKPVRKPAGSEALEASRPESKHEGETGAKAAAKEVATAHAPSTLSNTSAPDDPLSLLLGGPSTSSTPTPKSRRQALGRKQSGGRQPASADDLATTASKEEFLDLLLATPLKDPSPSPTAVPKKTPGPVLESNPGASLLLGSGLQIGSQEDVLSLLGSPTASSLKTPAKTGKRGGLGAKRMEGNI